jgi:hypothetical protein
MSVSRLSALISRIVGEETKYSIARAHIISCILSLIMSVFLQRMGLTQNNDQSSQPTIVDGWGVRCKVSMSPTNPKLGDIVEITCTLETPYKNIPESKVAFDLIQGAQLVEGDKISIHPPLTKGKATAFQITTEVISRVFVVQVGVYLRIPPDPQGREWEGVGGRTIDLITLAAGDVISYEKLGQDLEIWSRIGPEYQYDIEAGVRVPPMGRNYDKEAKNVRAQIEELKEMDPTLTDWEALELLHNVIEDMVVKYDIHDREESVSILIKARHLMKSEGLSKWDAVEEIIKKTRKPDGDTRFFRNNNPHYDNAGGCEHFRCQAPKVFSISPCYSVDI